MPNTSIKPVKSVKKTKSAGSKTKTAARPAVRVVTSKSSRRPSQQSRNRFVAGAVLAAAALVAITMGLMAYSKDADVRTSNGPAITDGSGAMFLQAVDGNVVEPGSTVTVSVYENSGKEPVNAVQSAITYPADKLEIVSVKTGSAFPQEAATDTSTKGLVRLARSIKPQTEALKGAKPIATLQFKVLQDATQPIQLNLDQSTSLLVRSTDNQNILQQSGYTVLDLK